MNFIITMAGLGSRFLKEGYDCCLLIAGSNDDKQIFSSLEPYFCNRIIYLGERDDAVDIMNSVDAMVLSSGWEGMPVTLVEALSVGCIPICSPVGGIPNVIEHGQNGLLSKSPSEEDYYQTMRSFLSLASESVVEMKEACICSFTPYDIAHTAASYLETYKAFER